MTFVREDWWRDSGVAACCARCGDTSSLTLVGGEFVCRLQPGCVYRQALRDARR